MYFADTIFGSDTCVSPAIAPSDVMFRAQGQGDLPSPASFLVAAAPVAADAVHDETSAEDPEACYAGAPFVQPEHEEEWMGFVNWAEVEAQAGGSSSS